jgi:sigma-B regulation protein RsbU (phosphoserine phosphatase)
MTIRLGRLEWVFLCLLALYFALSLIPAPGILGLLVTAALFVVGVWVFIRLSRRTVHHLLWRLRNRLIVAYVFIAFVPVVLISMLAFFGASLIGGQLSVYLVNSELERRTAALRSSIDYVVRNPAARAGWGENVAPYLGVRFPGLELVIEDRAGKWTYPADATITPPPETWQPGSGLVLKDKVTYGWAHAENAGRRVTALFPVTREFLGQMAPDVCESTIMDMGTGQVLVHPSLADSGVSHNRLPPALNRFDFEIRWGAPLPVRLWQSPEVTENRWLTVRTRPSAVLRTVFAQKVDLASDFSSILFLTVALAFLIAEVIAFIIGVSITRTITKAVHNLYEGTLRVRAGDFGHRIAVEGRDQLAELGVSFNEMTANMQRLLVVEKERERLQAELEIAREVQNQLYPKTVPEVETLRLTATCNPARMVSGDYYDYQQIDRDKVAIAVGDVAGKGISAALLMATIQSSFRSQIRGSVELAVSAEAHAVRIAVSTSTLVSHLNKQLYADTSPEKYATFYLGIYDDASSTLTYTNAGHLPPVLIHDGRVRRLEVNGMVVGAFPFAQYGESEVRLEPGDLVVFFTDGITEPENAYGEQFGEDRLVDLVVKNAHLDDRAIIDVVMDAVREWTGSDELQDDMTLLLVRRR